MSTAALEIPLTRLDEAEASSSEEGEQIVASRQGGKATLRLSPLLALLGGAIALLLAVNMALLGALLSTSREATATANRMEAPVLEMSSTVGEAGKVLGALSLTAKLLTGNLPNLANRVLRTDFGALAVNVTDMATSVGESFSDTYDVARIAGYVQSIGGVATQWQQISGGYAPPAGEDEGAAQFVEQIAGYVAQQMDKGAVYNAANTCVIAATAFLQIDWSGSFTVPSTYYGPYEESWSANGAKATIHQISQQCAKATNILSEELGDTRTAEVQQALDFLATYEA